MTNDDRELSANELGSVTGGGIVDNVLPESEAATTEFLKKFAEASQRFSTFINTPAAPPAATPQE